MATGVGTLNVSSNQLKMAVLKACRGIGLPVAQAQEVAAAIAASPLALNKLLAHLAKPISSASFDFSFGVDVQNAHLLRDFSVCADAVSRGAVLVILRGVAKCDVTQALAQYHGVSAEMDNGDLHVAPHQYPAQKSGRCKVDPDDWRRLGVYAALTYVPETDASRLAGAGAGLTDND